MIGGENGNRSFKLFIRIQVLYNSCMKLSIKFIGVKFKL